MFAQDCLELLVGQTLDPMTVSSRHSFGCDHRIDDGLLGGLDRCQEQVVDMAILQELRATRRL